MSASKEKKTRQEQGTSGWGDPKTAREARQRKEEKKTDRLYALIAVAFVLVAVVSLTWKSGIVQRKAPAASINGQTYSAAEVQFYYRSVYQNFITQYSSYISYLGLDTSKDLKTQPCQMDQDGGSWYDYFLKQALQQMSSVQALCDAAKKDSFDWTDAMESDYQDALKSLESSKDTYNKTYSASLSTKDYIHALYGKIVSESVYQEQVKRGILAQAYSTKYSDSLTYTTDDLTAAYEKDPNAYDAVDYQSVKVDGSVQKTDTSASASSSAAASGSAAASSSAEPTEAEKAAAMDNAKVLANSIYDSYKGGESLSDLADANKDLATYTNGEGGVYSDTVLMNWLFGTSRKAGDSTVLKDADNSAYYVVTFSSRYRYDYNTVDVRHILIQPESGTKSEGDDGYDAEQAQLKAAAKTKAEELLAKWKAGEATEDSFAALAKENSADTGSAADGGLYKQVYKGQTVASFEDWCFDSARKAGDTGVVESDYGYHIMYFVGTDLPYWQVQVTNKLKSADYSDWYTKLTKDYDAKQNSFGIRFVG